MSALAALAWLALAFAILPLALTLANLRGGRGGFVRPRAAAPAGKAVSVLIPARNEARNIEAAVRTALASTGVDVEVIVLDDLSDDDTAERVLAMASHEPRLRLLPAPPLPPGWAGKQRACHLLSQAARHDVLLFVDADVRLEPLAAAYASAMLLSRPSLGLVSGFPREVTASWAEHLVVPWIHVLLLGYLPMAQMRRSRQPALGAGCGQWMVARRDAYAATGGHAAAPLSLHDGLSLPRTFRRGGWDTDLFDGSELARCRMYRGGRQLWHGFGKSAGEGMATGAGLPVWALLILLGHVAPWLLLAVGVATRRPDVALPSLLGVGANVALRAALAARLVQRRAVIALHPLGALAVLAIQTQAWLRHASGRSSTWKGRLYGTKASALPGR